MVYKPDRISEQIVATSQLCVSRASSVVCECEASHVLLPHSSHFHRLARRGYKSDVKHVIWMQSCIRRRLARKELKALKAEARSVNKFKEISYKLENKVFELTQTLQKRTGEKKELQKMLEELEQQVQHWVGRHEESDHRAKQLQVDVVAANTELSRRDELLKAKEDIEKRLEDALVKAVEKEDAIQRLTEELKQRATQLENQQKLLDTAPTRSADDSIITTLKNEVSSLREQLNRANALNTLSRHGRAEPTSPTFAPGLRLPLHDGTTANGDVAVPASTGPPPRHYRRHSASGAYNVVQDNRTSADELMMMAKKTQATNPRSVSVIYGGDENYRHNGGLDDIYDDPAEEKIKLMQDVKRLDEDVLEGLIRGLKIPSPSITSPAAVKEILFPSNLISLTTNEMWRYGLIQESERFLASVLQTVQTHVMVRTITYGGLSTVLTNRSRFPERTPLFQEFSGFLTSMRCSPSFTWPRATCCKELVRVRRMLSAPSSGPTTRGLSPS